MIERPTRVLLAEDDDDHAKLVSKHFQRSKVNTEVVRVSNGEEVVDYLSSHTAVSLPDVILLDLNMPKRSGIEVLQLVKAEERWKNIPVVVLTTSNSPDDRKKAYASYANSYLVKPVKHAEFRDLIQEVGHYWGNCNLPVQD